MSLGEMSRFLKAINHPCNIQDAYTFYVDIGIWEYIKRPGD